MKARFILPLAVLGASLVVAGPAFAHHSMSMYDSRRDTTFKAVVTEFDWANPHSHIIFTATDEHGNVEKWDAEGPGPNRLANHGWSKDTLKPGDQVTIIGNCNKDGSPTMRFEKVILANGQELVGRPNHFY